MMDEVVNIETAKLARHKGFDLMCDASYVEYLKTQEHDNPSLRYSDGDIEFLSNPYMNGAMKDRKNYKQYAAPTQTKLSRWLREVKNLDIGIASYQEVDRVGGGESRRKYTAMVSDWNEIISTHDGTGLQMPMHWHLDADQWELDSWEVAMELGLQTALGTLPDVQITGGATNSEDIK
jgi:hypothetical protein